MTVISLIMMAGEINNSLAEQNGQKLVELKVIYAKVRQQPMSKKKKKKKLVQLQRSKE